MCLQYTDFSRTVIGSFVPVLSDWSLKREVSLSLQDIHSVPFLSFSALPGQQNERLQMDGSGGGSGGGAGGDEVKHTQEFLLADHYLTHRQGKAISTATNSLLSSCNSILSQQIFFLSATDTEISEELRT